MNNKFKNLFIALRPWSFSASLTPVLLGSVLAYNKLNSINKPFQFTIFILTLIIAICVHGAGNLVNTYFDYKYGIDNENSKSDRILVDKILKPEDITRFGVALYFFGSLSFLTLLFFSPAKGSYIL
jgi:1,4-dihydroxy-2-naphthoate octaprenyltransferase